LFFLPHSDWGTTPLWVDGVFPYRFFSLGGGYLVIPPPYFSFGVLQAAGPVGFLFSPGAVSLHVTFPVPFQAGSFFTGSLPSQVDWVGVDSPSFQPKPGGWVAFGQGLQILDTPARRTSCQFRVPFSFVNARRETSAHTFFFLLRGTSFGSPSFATEIDSFFALPQAALVPPNSHRLGVTTSSSSPRSEHRAVACRQTTESPPSPSDTTAQSKLAAHPTNDVVFFPKVPGDSGSFQLGYNPLVFLNPL